ncbi:MAG: cytochrome c [Bacteroidetes bacterium]|nr:MAG: cytochrome c [Bacteroidota bacterium]
MNRIGKFLFVFFIFCFSCGKSPSKKMNSENILKEGAELYAKYGCAVCHSLDGKEIYGPPLNRIYMKEIKVVRNGKELILTADRDYLKKAITDPRYEKVLEYRNKEMPLTQISDEEAEILVDYIIALDEKNKAGE